MTNEFNPLNHSICLAAPQRLVFPNSWVTHIPFAMYLMSALKPSIFVELGTHTGNSYCGFCQAVATLNLETRCYAVDTWEGDEQAGFYGLEVFEDLSKYHDPKYNSFSRLLKMTFDEAKDYFSDNSISLLHIDGLHTYEAVKHDFENWKLKLSQNAIVIFHDTNVRDRGFGVWKYWEEIATIFPNFEFLHGNGLGIMCMGQPDQVGLADLFDPNNLEDIRAFFASVGMQYNFPIEKDYLRQVINEKDQIIQEKDQIIQEKDQIIQEKDLIIRNREQIIQEKDQIIQENDLIIRNRDQIREKDQINEEHIQKLILLENQLSKNRSETRNIETKFESEIKLLQQALDSYKYEIALLRESNSWKITRPFRKIMKYLRGK